MRSNLYTIKFRDFKWVLANSKWSCNSRFNQVTECFHLSKLSPGPLCSWSSGPPAPAGCSSGLHCPGFVTGLFQFLSCLRTLAHASLISHTSLSLADVCAPFMLYMIPLQEHLPWAPLPSKSKKRGLMLFPFIALSFPPCHVICVHGMEDLFASSVSATVLFVMNTGNICFAHHYIFSLLVLITSFMPQLYSWNIAGGPHIFIP